MPLTTNTELSGYTTLGIGGPARRFEEAHDEGDLVRLLSELDAAGERVLVLAGGSNVVVGDEGWDGTVVRVATRGVERSETAQGQVRLEVQAGEPWDDLVALTVAGGLAGFEALSGIPGSTGATPIQNVGAYGQDVSQTVAEVRVLDRARGEVRSLSPAECAFGYRTSALRGQDRLIVLAVSFGLEPSELSRPIAYAELARTLGVEVGERAPLGDVRATVLDLRRNKGMVVDASDADSRSAGSFFTNPILSEGDFAALERRVTDRLGRDLRPPRYPADRDDHVKTSAAWLIERAGFERGHSHGAAAISSKHTLALTNRGGATAADLLGLAREVRDGVQRAFGVTLHPEPVLGAAEL